MADFSGLTSRQHVWLTSEAYKMMRRVAFALCDCGNGPDHALDCRYVLDTERQYDCIIEQLRGSMPDDAEFLRAEGTPVH